MTEKGFPRVTLREVAERAGVKPALVHYYFEGKRGLVEAVIGEVAGRGLARMQEATRPPHGLAFSRNLAPGRAPGWSLLGTNQKAP